MLKQIKEMKDDIELRLQKMETEESYLRFSLGQMKQLIEDIESGKVELQ